MNIQQQELKYPTDELLEQHYNHFVQTLELIFIEMDIDEMVSYLSMGVE